MTGPTVNDERVVEELDEVWASVVDACQDLGEAQWELSTDCPGWTVKDNVSHLIGVERMILGDESPPRPAELPAHVRNSFGELNEAWVDARRGVPGDEVLAEFVATTTRRLEALRAMPPAAFDVVGWSPVGDVPYREFMGTRVMDSWAHEQDIRRALERPGGRNRAGEQVALERCAKAMPYVVGKKVAPPDGTTVVFAVTGVLGTRLAVGVSGGRAAVLDAAPAEPTVTITLDEEAFWRIGFGRVDGPTQVDDGRVVLTGDAALGRSVLAAMAFMI
jgi:uncharacterized protein (TIGR03083 family)